jgi:hypothetical protein
MVNVVQKMCLLCTTISNYNYKNTTIPLYCAKHKHPDMININAKTCKEDGCYKIPTFNNKGIRPGIYCNTHKKDGMINITSKHCAEQGCICIPCFNIKGAKRGLYCNTHKKPDMISTVVCRRCQTPLCREKAYFNYEGQKRAKFCIKHMEDTMVNVATTSCMDKDCSKQAYFNHIGKTFGLYCETYRKSDMIDVIGMRGCQELDCKGIILYCDKDDITKTYCTKHKTNGCIVMDDKRCVHNGCTLFASYNIDGETKKIYCLKHKQPEMIKISKKTCKHDGCTITPCFNYEGLYGLYCNTHKLDTMIDVSHRIICKYNGCKTRPSYNIEGEKTGLYCVTHKTSEMIDVTSKICIAPNCATRHITDKYNGYCLRCFVNLFPDAPNSRNYKTKEKTVADHICNIFSDYTWSTDKTIQDGCSKKRPDLLLDLGIQVIIIEVDENQHNKYDCSCENKRLMELSQDIGHRPLVFIRFNPDGYDTSTGHVQSCWSYTKAGVCVVKRDKESSWKKRLDALDAQIQYWSENSTDKTVEVIQLFYNCD